MIVAAIAAATAVDTRAHGGSGMEWIAVPFLIAVAGVAACVIVHLGFSRAPFPLRLVGAIALAALDIGISIGVGAFLFVLAGLLHMPSDEGYKALLFVAALITWILPVALFIRAHRRDA